MISNDELLEKLFISNFNWRYNVGLEAAFFNKPSIVFADVIYSILKSVVKRLKIYQNCPKIIRISSLKFNVELNDLNKYIQTIEKISFKIESRKN